MTAGLPFMKSVPTPLAKNVLLFGLSAAISATDAVIQKSDGSGTTALIEHVEDVVKIFKSPKESGLLIQGISEITANKTKEKKANFSECY